MKMKITEETPFPPNTNPFCHDLYHMGVDIGSNITILMPNHSNDPCPYFYIVNTDTGERLLITVNEEGMKRGTTLAAIVNNPGILSNP